MNVRADRKSDAVPVISALLLWLIKSYFDFWNSASRASLTTLKESILCSLGYDTTRKIYFVLVPLAHLHIRLTSFLEKKERLSLTGKGEASNYYPFYVLCWCSPFLSLFSSCATCVCAQYFSPQRLRIKSTPQSQRITLNISIHYTLHIYTPVLLCFPFKVCVSSFCVLPHPARTCLTKQNMSVTGRIWKYG